jgi:predicted TIM-barrel fold metal-dependent hydrolase
MSNRVINTRISMSVLAMSLALSGQTNAHPMPAACAGAVSAQGAAAPAAGAVVKPLVDHHLHLLSPYLAEVINGRALPEVEVPSEVARLLRARGEAYNSIEALKPLYTEDAVVLVQTPQKSALYRGAGVAARHFSNRARFPYRLVPVSYHGNDRIALLTGNYVTGGGPQQQYAGTFQIGLEKAAQGSWRIASESPAFLNGPPQAPYGAADAIALLDAAGARRAVVLSGGGAFGGRYFDVAGQEETSADRYRRVVIENDWTIQQTSKYPDRLISFCSFNPLEPYALDELRRCAKTGHRGLKMSWTESSVDLQNKKHVARLREVFSLANTLRLPIVVHVGNNTGPKEKVSANVRTFLDEIVPAAQNVIIQVAHLWGGGGYSPAGLGSYADAVSAGHPSTRHLYFDMSEAPMIAANSSAGSKAEVIREVTSRMRQIGLNRILFGSDAFGKAHNTPKEAWDEFREVLPLTEGEFGIVATNVAPYLR